MVLGPNAGVCPVVTLFDTATLDEVSCMTRLTRSARGLLVAIAALALTGGAVFAARSLPSSAASGTQHASDVSGKTVPASQAGGATNDNETPDANEAPETPDTEDNEAASDANRPQDNHGWFVSQAASGETPAGYDNHGDYVSSVAQSDQGKTKTNTTGATHSAAGKAKAAAARAAHQD
jgi:hypothetical protein